jgi:hypothetical protein
VVEEAAVGCRGVLFAIDQDEIRALWQATSDKEVRAFVATIEQHRDERFLALTDSLGCHPPLLDRRDPSLGESSGTDCDVW